MKNIANLICSLLLVLAVPLSAQITDQSTTQNNLVVCETESTSSFTLQVQGGFTGDLTLDYSLPAGVTYIDASAAVSGDGILTLQSGGGTDSPQIVISRTGGGAWVAAETVTITITRAAGCDAVGVGNQVDAISVAGAPGGPNNFTTATYNVDEASLSTIIGDPIISTTLGMTECRNVTINQGGNGFVGVFTHSVTVGDDLGNYALDFGGIPLTPATTTPNGDGTTTLEYTIDFSAAPFTTAAGGDGAFNNGEDIVVQECFEVNGCSQATAATVHQSFWGCGGEVCQMSTPASGFVNVPVGLPSVTVTSNNIIPDCPFEDRSTYQFKIVVDGTGGALVMSSLTSGATGQNGGNAIPDLSTARYEYVADGGASSREVSVGTTINSSSNRPACAAEGTTNFARNWNYTNSDFPVVQPGDTLYVRVDVDVCCTADQFCNSSDVRWLQPRWDFSYTDECGGNIRSRTVTSVDLGGQGGPAPLISGPVFLGPSNPTGTMVFEYSGNILYLNEPASSRDNTKILVTFELPAGIIPDLNSYATFEDGASAWMPSTVNYTPGANQATDPGTLTVEYMTMNKPSTTTNLVLPKFSFDISLTCDTPDGPVAGGTQVITQKIQVDYNAGCTGGGCLADLRCDEFALQIVCPGPCPEGGTFTTGFFIERTKYGLVDGDNNGEEDSQTNVDPATPGLAKDRFVAGDTVRTKLTSVVIGGTGQPFIDADLSRIIPRGDLFTNTNNATFTVTRPGGMVFTATALIPSSSAVNVDQELVEAYEFDPTTLGFPAGFEFMPDDTLCVEAFYTINATEETVADNDFLFSGVLQNNLGLRNAADPATLFSCFQLNGQFFLIGSGLVAGGGAGRAFNSCDTAATSFTVDYRLGPNPDFDFFPFEVRELYRIDFLDISMPGAWDIVDASWRINGIDYPVEPSIFQGPQSCGGRNLIRYPVAYPPVVYDETNEQVVAVLSVRSVLNCCSQELASNTSLNGSGIAHINFACVDETFLLGRPDLEFFEPSDFSATLGGLGFRVTDLANLNFTQLPPTINAATEQFSWDLQITNGSSVMDAENTFIAVESPNGNIVVDSISTGGVAITQLGSGVYGAGTIPAGGNAVVYTIHARQTGCGEPDVLNVMSGYSCSGIPDDLAELEGFDCNLETLVYEVTPIPSQIQLQITDQPIAAIDLCDPFTVEVTINSAQAADIVNPRVRVDLPPGLVIDDNMVEYPANSGNLVALTPVANGANSFIFNLIDHPALTGDSIPGVQTTNMTDPRMATLELTFLTNCDFNPNSAIDFTALAERPCNGPAAGNGETTSSNAIEVTGITSYAAIPTLDLASAMLNCEDAFLVTIAQTIVGGTTGATDSAYLYLPEGLTYQAASLACTSPDGADCLTFVDAIPDPTSNGTIARFIYAAGIDNGDVVSFTFNIDVADDQSCGLSEVIRIENRVTLTPLMCMAGVCSNNATLVTGQATGQVEIVKANLNVTDDGDICLDDSGNATFTGSVTLTDLALGASEEITGEVICVTGGAVLHSFSIVGPLAIGDVADLNESFATAGCDLTGGIEVRFDPSTGSCVCEPVVLTPEVMDGPLSITAAASCDDAAGMQVAENMYYVVVSAITGGNGGPYEVNVSDALTPSQFFDGNGSLFFGPFTHSGAGGDVQEVTATDNGGGSGCEITGSYEVPEILCGINDGGQASGCFCAGPTTDPTVPTSFILAQSAPGTFMAGGSSGQIQKYVLVNDQGIIVGMNLTGLFEVPIAGTYTPYAINYREDEDPLVMNFLIPGEPIQPILDGVTGTGPLADACFAACNIDNTVTYESCSCYSVGSTLFSDLDNDGLFEEGDGENGLPGIVVEIYAVGADPLVDAPIGTTTTDSNGDYYFGGLDPNMYFLNIPTPSAVYPISSTPTDVADNGEDNDDNGTQTTSGTPVTSPIFELGGAAPEPSGTAESGTGGTQDDAADLFGDMTQDFGFIAPVTVGDTTFVDVDMDGTQSTGDLPLANVTVTIYDLATGLPVALDAEGMPYTSELMTDAMGAYLFENLPPGNYYVEFDISTSPDGAYYDFTTPNAGGNDATDSDAVPAAATDDVANSSATGPLTSAQSDLTLDAGVVCAVLVTVAQPFTICATATIDLTTDASVLPAVLGGNWTTADGSGVFLDNTDTPITAAPYIFGVAVGYVPSAADRGRGYVTLTLTSNTPPALSGCSPVSEEVRIEILNVDCGSFFWDGSND